MKERVELSTIGRTIKQEEERWWSILTKADKTYCLASNELDHLEELHLQIMGAVYSGMELEFFLDEGKIIIEATDRVELDLI